MMPCDTHSPRPVPLPGFVEKNGSKNCAMTSSGMPSPVSRTWIVTTPLPTSSASAPYPPCVETVIVPPLFIESPAVRGRVRITCLDRESVVEGKGHELCDIGLL